MMYGSVVQLLDKAFGKGEFSRDKENYQVSCPECLKSKKTSKRKLHIKIDDLRYHCWVCGLKGKNIVSFIRKIRPGLVPKDSFITKEVFKSPEEEKEIKLPPGLSLVYKETKDPDIKAVKNYLISRGITVQKMRRWRILAAKSGSLRRHAIIPSFDNEGVLNYYVGRSIDESIFRYKNAKKSKLSVIFNDIDLDWTRTINLVEGVFDAIKCPENTIPILGSALSKSSILYKKLAKFQPDVVISLDPDLPEKAYQVADSLSATGCKTYITFAPIGKDLGDMTYVDAKNIISKKVEYNSYMKLRHKIGTLRSGSIF